MIGIGERDAPVYYGEHTFEGGMKAAEHFLALKRRPAAILYSNDLMAVGALRVLARRRISVPFEFSVIRFDDIHLAEVANPPLSTVRMSRADLALNAFHALEHMRRGKPPEQNPVCILTCFVLRQSTA